MSANATCHRSPNTRIKHLPAIAELAGTGTLRPTVGLEAPFSDALSAITNAENGPRSSGKIVLTFEGAGTSGSSGASPSLAHAVRQQVLAAGQTSEERQPW